MSTRNLSVNNESAFSSHLKCKEYKLVCEGWFEKQWLTVAIDH